MNLVGLGARAMLAGFWGEDLEQRELDAGYVLTCQALPQTDEITVDYDA